MDRTLSYCLVTMLALAGCSSTQRPPLRLAEHVEISRFMGDWYVIANIPTFVETGAHNAIESYRLDDDGTIATTFTFREGSFDGEPKRYQPRGFVSDHPSNAVWGMQFVWPFKGDFRIVYVDPGYTTTIIGRESRDYVWIMARKPHIPDDQYRELIELLRAEGYDVSLIQRVPQKWDDPAGRGEADAQDKR